MSILTLLLFGFVFLLIIHYILNNTYVVELLEKKKHPSLDMDEDTLIEHHMFYNYNKLESLQKNKIFIHLPYERNERNWINFGSRSTKRLNLDICMLCIQSIIKQLGDEMEIILYHNDNVKDLIGEMNESDLCNVQNPAQLSGVDLSQWESYCKAKILYKYGGIVIEPYYYFITKPPKNILFPRSLTLCHEVNTTNVSEKRFIPTTNHWMSAPVRDADVGIYIKYMNHLCINDYAVDHKHFDKTFEKLYALKYIHPKKIGCANHENKPIYVSDLLMRNNIDFDSELFCLFINVPELKKYRKHGWILKMNESQIKNTKTFLGEFIQLYE
tara:strand:- start:738 stop:1721 length:984 start_codon:yes stop_codon:yes gene_type:complete